MTPLLYVAVPFTHSEASVREQRFQAACRVSALLMKHSIVVFSPLSHSVPIVRHGDLDEMDSEYWLTMDLPLLERADELLIVGLDGWEESRGVQEELHFALEHNTPITLIEEKDIERLPAIPKSGKLFLTSKILTEDYDAK